ncbi:flavin reductase family protein [Thetidibacter halocola]|uniref:Flavin reductase family protein n=1 Tax=Thetidibacter halocola TaxID=2827239 RepID=A0A8J7WBK1_9RHOB|nr:flavin reductase family protein [Thetidibacter halocola]MBS0122691.1 flavin reductase family protein [Thetidibacter halocola]
MQIDLDALPPKDRYKLLTAVVIPRPVAWVTTVNAQGLVNAAPYSFFNVFGQDPAVIILGLEHRADGSPKDTTRNIDETGEFVVNIATPDLVEAMVGTAAAYGPDESEPEALGLDLAPSAKVAPPRLAQAPVAIECVRMMALSLSAERSIMLGRAVALSCREGLVDPDTLRLDWGGDFPVARLFADRYARLEEIARHAIPQPKRP